VRNSEFTKEFEKILNSLSDPVSIHDRNFKICWVNEAFCITFRRGRDELVGRTCYKIIHNLNSPSHRCPFVCGNFDENPLVERCHSESLDLDFEVKVYPLEMSERGFQRLIHIVRNLTAVKSVHSMQLVDNRLMKFLKVTDEICHEISQPLQTAIGYSELLLFSLSKDDPLGKRIRIIQSQIERISDITKRLSEMVKTQKVDSCKEVRFIDMNKNLKK